MAGVGALEGRVICLGSLCRDIARFGRKLAIRVGQTLQNTYPVESRSTSTILRRVSCPEMG